MIDVGINDGDLVLVRQQETANYNDIVVALVENEVTLKRYRPDNESTSSRKQANERYSCKQLSNTRRRYQGD